MMAETLFTPNTLNFPNNALKINKIDSSYDLSTNNINSNNVLELSLPHHNINLLNNTINFNPLIYFFILFNIFSYLKTNLSINTFDIYNFFYSSFITDFLTFNDIQLLGFMIYLTYPFITILLGILLWCVLIGV
jgi:hypothetical protein